MTDPLLPQDDGDTDLTGPVTFHESTGEENRPRADAITPADESDALTGAPAPDEGSGAEYAGVVVDGFTDAPVADARLSSDESRTIPPPTLTEHGVRVDSAPPHRPPRTRTGQ